MANIKISQLPSLATLADTTVFSTVDSGVNYKSSALSIKNYITWPVTNTTGSNGPTNIAIGQNAGATGIGNVAIGVGAAGTGNNIITIGTNAGQGYTGNGSILIGPTGSVSANSLIVFNATGSTLTPVSAQNDSFYVAPIRNNAGTSGVLQYNSTTKEVTYGNAITIGGKTWTFGTDGELSLPKNSYTEAVIKELSATALVLFAQSTGGNIKLLAGTTSAGSAKQWLFNGTDGTLSSKMFLASAGSYGTTGYSFTGDGGLDTGMFSAGDGQIQFYSNTVKVAEIASGNLTISGHPTIEGVTTTGATGTGKLVFDNAPTFSGHPTIEGVTTTGATGTGKLVFDNAPTFSGHITVEGVTSTGATGTGKLVFDDAPTFSGAVTVSNNTQSTSSTTGALIIAGGVGITRSLNVDGVISTPTLLVKDVRDTVYDATFASTFTPDAANGAIQNVTLTGSITINEFASPQTGQTVTLILTQGGSGSYTLTSTMKFAGGLKTLSTAVDSIDMLTITYTGSVYYASLVTGFV